MYSLFSGSLNIWLIREHLQDLTVRPKYLVTFTVGYEQRQNINKAVKKVGPYYCAYGVLIYVFGLALSNKSLQLSKNFAILLFHYDGRASEWDEFEWSKKAIHLSAQKQTKW